MIELREYQKQAIVQTKEALAQFDRVCAVMPTGAGKSTVFSRFVQICIRNKKRVLFFVHSKELVEQFAQCLIMQFDIPSGIIMSKIKPKPHRLVQVASVQTLVRRERPEADVVIIDECHRSKAKSYEKIISWYPKAKIIGLTATPFRADGKPLGEIYQNIVHPVKIRELMEMGYLVPTKVFVPKQSVNMEGVKTKAGDYDIGEMANRFSDNGVVDGVVENYLKFAKGKKMIVFNVNVEHSKLVNNKFLENGIPSAHLDGTTSKAIRSQIINQFRNDEIRVLNNVALFTEGFDVPDTDGVILNRATKSEGLYVQMVGRGLRLAEGKTECIVLDHGDNTIRFGFVEDYDQRPFKLNEKKQERESKPRKCKQCNQGIMKHTHTDEEKIYSACTSCGFEMSRERKKKLNLGESAEFVLLERDAIVVEKLYKAPYSKVKQGKIPLSELRLYEKLKKYKKGWSVHAAIDSGLVDVDKDNPNAFKEVNFILSMAEKQADTERILKEINEQS
ncbi:DEAD/DEAH box helicase [Bernardetia sp.]|uniref:DEAD/DEAH box helicase n=1 Tax=Bernardetia sp. TaxID=1937974 RepID=UPI0025BF2BC3|nr:DEAD/DEAH box helicase [Bernardetia sp.]